jgi:5'-methylthioadenosine phosphorylase
MEPVSVGVIGGSGVYEMEGLTDIKEIRVKTPFGDPSDAIVVGTLEGVRVAFLPRHGRGHFISPSELPARANIYAMKSLGVQRLIAFSACGSMKEEIAPLHIVIPDQLFDRTKSRPSTFSTKAESRIYRSWGVDVIGMTALPEAKLAREAEICYATLGLVTDYDVWHESEETVTVEMIVQNLSRNAEMAKKIVRLAIRTLGAPTTCPCPTALQTAIITNPAKIPAEAKQKLSLLLKKYM